MYHLFFLSFLSVLFFMNTGHSATAVAKASKISLKINSLLKEKKMRAEPDIFTHAHWAQYEKKILGFGSNQLAIVMESAMPTFLQHSSRLTVIEKDLIHLPKKELNHADLVLSCLHNIAPLANVLLIKPDINRDYILSLEKKQLEHIEKAHVITRSQTFKDGSDAALSYLKVPENHNPETISLIKTRSREQVQMLKDLLMIGNEKILVQAGGNQHISLSNPVIKSGSNVLDTTMKTMSEDEYMRDRLIIAGAIGQRFAHTKFSVIPGINKRIQNITLFTLGEDVNLHLSKKFVSGTSFAAPIISGALLLLKEKFPTLTIFEIKEVLLESASRTFTIEDKNNLKRITFVYESDEEEPNLDFLEIPKDYSLRVKFTPIVWGKGVLDLRAALIYGKLKVENGSLSAEILRSRMKEILKTQQNSAATKIQALVRGHQARKRIDRTKKENSAATKIQALVRSHQARKRIDRTKKENSAATKIQALVRGHQARKKFGF